MESESKISWSKGKLAVELSKLEGFREISVKLEQYATPSEIAAEWLWNATLKGDIRGKVSLDAACGPGILGLGTLLLGAEKVYFVDKSKEALELAKVNYDKLREAYGIDKNGKSEFRCQDIADFNVPVDVVLQNPPFGTKIRHHDRLFLERAFIVGKIVYSMHKISTRKFVEAMAKDHGFTITDLWEYDFPIKATQRWHRRRVHNVKVGLWRMEKIEP